MSGVFSFSEAKQWAYTGTTLLTVGGREQIQSAVAASHRAVDLYRAGPEEERSPGDVRAAHLDLATAYLTSGEVEGAGTELSEVLDADGHTASITIRLRKLAALLGSGPYRDAQPVVDLREHIHEVTVRPTRPTEPR
ncbi:hypothetical protein [Streptomyces yaizuensis]|uniref:Tetratricopeptide repeat protein n=1 Tax=Streptomyces yaizuensis TaxID=2989713 RepID=A0ABQ5NZK3_9ACTN|nr:hypothetical protein [Streptomyces sp. YSPA8]GLF95787.1 hypothetical protein SYYSPA8_15840 [Streptomyces sp. YSPA8]